MPASKIDALIAELLNVREALGGFRSDVSTLFKRTSEDREATERRHEEHQRAIGDLRQEQQKSISELRIEATRRWDENTAAIQLLSKKIDAQADAVATVRAMRGVMPKVSPRIAFYATIGFGVVIAAGWILEASIKYGVNYLLAKWGH